MAVSHRSGRLDYLVIDSPDPRVLAAFGTRVLSAEKRHEGTLRSYVVSSSHLHVDAETLGFS